LRKGIVKDGVDGDVDRGERRKEGLRWFLERLVGLCEDSVRRGRGGLRRSEKRTL
jgi:hypothetical protein